MALVLTEGMEVEANFGGLGEWYAAVIRGEKVDGTFDIEYDYGDIETNVTYDRLRIPFDKTQSNIPGEAGLSARSSYSNFTHLSPINGITNTITAQSINDYDTIGSIDELGSLGELSQIVFTPRGETISSSSNAMVPSLSLGLRGPMSVTSTDTIDSTIMSPPPHAIPIAKFHLEDRVEADYCRRGKWYPGTVKKVREDLHEISYDIFYDDGEIEIRIEENRLRVLKTTASVEDLAPNFGQSESSKLNMSNAAATVSIASKLMGKTSFKAVDSKDAEVAIEAVESFRDGNRVEANYRGRGKWYPGEVRRVREEVSVEGKREVSYDVGYDDGEIEVRVASENVRVIPSTSLETGKEITNTEVCRKLAEPEDAIENNDKLAENDNAINNNDKETDKLAEPDNAIESNEKETNLETLPEKIVQETISEAVRIVSRNESPAHSRPMSASSSTAVAHASEPASKDLQSTHSNCSSPDVRVAVEAMISSATENVSRQHSRPSSAAKQLHMADEAATVNIAHKLADKQRQKSRSEGESSVTSSISLNNNAADLSLVPTMNMSNAAATVSIASKLMGKTSSETVDSKDAEDTIVSGNGASTELLRDGNRVEANYRGRGKWYPGEVRRVREEVSVEGKREVSYDVGYDDGEIEVRVASENVRAGSCSADSVAPITEPRSLESLDHGFEAFIKNTVADAVDDVSHDSHKHLDDAKMHFYKNESKENENNDVFESNASAVLEVTPSEEKKVEMKGEEQSESAQPFIEAEKVKDSTVDRPNLVHSSESMDRCVQASIINTVTDAIDDVSNHSQKHIEVTNQCHRGEITEPKVDNINSEIKLKEDDEAKVAFGNIDESSVECSSREDPPSISEIQSPEEESRAEEGLDDFQYSGPAVSQRKAIRDLHAAHAEQREQLTASLNKVSAMKLVLQNRQISLNNATKKAKNIMLDLQDHLAVLHDAKDANNEKLDTSTTGQ